MIARILFLVTLATASLLAWEPAHAQARAKPVAVGETAPDFTLTDQDGRTHSLSPQRGKRPVVLVFYRGHW
jgi:cytochrome oxidase Cu insertion factor (SCO1/SenC/PrrC family)